ncbi:MAG: hypothetical protein ACR2NP_02705, partial [Pirellulaceae bacterium]
MSKIKATLALLIAATAFTFTSSTPSTASAQDSTSMNYYHYYVYREATHLGSGGSYVQEYGPYSSQAEAEAQCAQLDSNRNFGTWFYGLSWWEREINPNVFVYQNSLYYQ